MAKVKSKKITVDDALVPVEEQPYKVPLNWCWTYLLTGAAKCMDAYRKPINATERASREGNIPYYGATGQVGWIDDYLTDEQLVLLGEDGAPFLDLIKDKAYIIEGKAWVNNHAHILKSLYGETGNRFLMYYLNTFNYHGFVNGTTRLKLTQANMGTIPVPLPPLSEQQRIVEKIESLYSKLDEAKDKAQEVIDGFDSRRAAILAQAFSGKLTEMWRREKNKEDVSWQMRELDSVCRSIFDGDHMPPPKTESGIPFIFISNVNTGQLSLEQTNYVSQEYYDQLTETRKPQKGDVLYTLVGSYGIAALVDTEQSFCFQRHMALLKPEKVLSRYLWYALQDKKVYDAATAIATGTAQLTVPIKGLRKIKISVPSVEEQIKIAESLDTIFNLENKAKEEANKVIENIRNIKKAVLTKAFRGELGTQDSSDEPAEELLKRILIEAPVEEKKKSTTRKKKVKVVMNKDMLEAVREAGKITPERLKEETGLGVDEFYEELKRLTESGQVSEKREGGDVYLEVRDAN